MAEPPCGIYPVLPGLQCGEAEQPSSHTGTRELGDMSHRARAEGQGATSACTHLTYFSIFAAVDAGELLMGNDSELNCCLGSSPACAQGKRARGEGHTEGPSAGSPAALPQGRGATEKTLWLSAEPQPEQPPAGARARPTWSHMNAKKCSVLHHNITILNRHHLSLCLAPYEHHFIVITGAKTIYWYLLRPS